MSHPVETQEELIEKLRESGFSCTQATISRDIKELYLIKELSEGAYRYTVSKKKDTLNSETRLRRILHECCTGCSFVENVVVLKTLPGLANAAGAALDAMANPEMLGCVCGDDTVIIVMRSEQSAQAIHGQIEQICK